MASYFIYNEGSRLYDGKAFFSVIKLKEYFHTAYFEEKDWKKDFGVRVDYSNDQRLSNIKNSLPGISEYCEKARLYENLRGKSYMPDYINFSIEEENWYENNVRTYLPYDDSVWFLKKSNIITYGGFDVFPLRASKYNFRFKLEKALRESNKHRKYYSSSFTLQKAITNLYLTSEKKKFDLRCYGLIVWINGKLEFYYYNAALIRKNPKFYEKDSEDRSIQLTNTTFNRQSEDMTTITELMTKEHPYWNKFFKKTKDIYEDICRHILKNKVISAAQQAIGTKNSGYHLLGLDFIPDVNENIFLLEINKYPAIYYDEKIDSLHKGMEKTMFRLDNFYRITFDAFDLQRHYCKNTSDFYYCPLD